MNFFKNHKRESLLKGKLSPMRCRTKNMASNKFLLNLNDTFCNFSYIVTTCKWFGDKKNMREIIVGGLITNLCLDRPFIGAIDFKYQSIIVWICFTLRSLKRLCQNSVA